jgi:hypothetical protein
VTLPFRPAAYISRPASAHPASPAERPRFRRRRQLYALLLPDTLSHATADARVAALRDRRQCRPAHAARAKCRQRESEPRRERSMKGIVLAMAAGHAQQRSSICQQRCRLARGNQKRASERLARSLRCPGALCPTCNHAVAGSALSVRLGHGSPLAVRRLTCNRRGKRTPVGKVCGPAESSRLKIGARPIPTARAWRAGRFRCT